MATPYLLSSSTLSSLSDLKPLGIVTSIACFVQSCFSCVLFFVTLWTIACQAPLSMGFSSKNTGVECHALLHGIFPTQGSNLFLLCLLHWQAGSLPLAPPGKHRKFYVICSLYRELHHSLSLRPCPPPVKCCIFYVINAEV